MSHGKPPKKSTLTLKQVDAFLDELTQVTREDEQVQLFAPMVAKCTGGAPAPRIDARLTPRLMQTISSGCVRSSTTT